MKIKQTLIAAFFVSIGLVSTSVRAEVKHDAVDAILKEVVHDGRVDYVAVKEKHLAALTGYLDSLATVDPASLPRDEQLALYINLYNASMIKAVVDRYRPDYSPSEDNFKVFKEPLVRVGGKTISLDDVENKIVRPTFKEPRIHVALVCGAESCPPILNRAYRADDLDATLEANMKRFVADAFRNPIDASKKELKLSNIFNWFAADFGGADKVPAYVGRYLGTDVTGWKVSNVDYSWKLNRVP